MGDKWVKRSMDCDSLASRQKIGSMEYRFNRLCVTLLCAAPLAASAIYWNPLRNAYVTRACSAPRSMRAFFAAPVTSPISAARRSRGAVRPPSTRSTVGESAGAISRAALSCLMTPCTQRATANAMTPVNLRNAGTRPSHTTSRFPPLSRSVCPSQEFQGPAVGKAAHVTAPDRDGKLSLAGRSTTAHRTTPYRNVAHG